MTKDGATSVAPVADDDRAMFGEFLSSARRRAGRSLEDVAASTKLSRRYLEALERGRVELLPPGMYRRAMLRSYAESVALDPQAALERFDRTFAPPPGPPDRRTDAAERRNRPPGVPASSFPAIALPSMWAVEHLRLRRPVLPAPHFAATGALVLAAVVSVYIVSQRSTETGGLRVEPTDAPAVLAPATEAGFVPASDAIGAATPSTGTAGNQETVGVAVDRAEDPSLATADPRLVVTSNPAGARVTVDGIGWGVTPLTVRHLPPGDKIVRVTKDGYVASERRVQVGTSGATPSVRLTLRRREGVPERAVR